MGKIVENSWDGPGYPCSHQDERHSRQHRTIEGGECRGLDFLKKVDANRPIMAFLGEKNLGEVGQHRQFREVTRIPIGVKGSPLERLTGRLASGDEIPVENTARHFGKWEMVEGSPDMSSQIPKLKASHKDGINGGS